MVGTTDEGADMRKRVAVIGGGVAVAAVLVGGGVAVAGGLEPGEDGSQDYTQAAGRPGHRGRPGGHRWR